MLLLIITSRMGVVSYLGAVPNILEAEKIGNSVLSGLTIGNYSTNKWNRILKGNSKDEFVQILNINEVEASKFLVPVKSEGYVPLPMIPWDSDIERIVRGHKISTLLNSVWNNLRELPEYLSDTKYIKDLFRRVSQEAVPVVESNKEISVRNAPYVFVQYLRAKNWEPLGNKVVQTTHTLSVLQTDLFEIYQKWAEQKGLVLGEDYKSKIIKIWDPQPSNEWFVLERI